MRDLRIIEDASVCQDAGALRDPAITTYLQVQSYERHDCPLIGPCSAGTLLGPRLRNCVPRMAQDVARYAARSGGSVEAEMREFRGAPVFSDLGFIDPYDNPEPDATIADEDEICRRVAEWAETILNGNPTPLEQQVKEAHCGDHDHFSAACMGCGLTRTAVLIGTVTVYPGGVTKVVPRDQCRCPILKVGDSCPVHGG